MGKHHRRKKPAQLKPVATEPAQSKPVATEHPAMTMFYWFCGVISTFLPMMLSIIVAGAASQELTIGGEEFMMLACLILFATLIDYFRSPNKKEWLHQILAVVMFLFTLISVGLYSVFKALGNAEKIVILQKATDDGDSLMLFPESVPSLPGGILAFALTLAFFSELALHFYKKKEADKHERSDITQVAGNTNDSGV